MSYIHDPVPGLGSCRSLGKDTFRWRDPNSRKSPEQQDCKASFYPSFWRTQCLLGTLCTGFGGWGQKQVTDPNLVVSPSLVTPPALSALGSHPHPLILLPT